MTPTEYIKAALRTESAKWLSIATQDARVLHAAIGICTEAGELLDVVKKFLFYGKEPETTNMIEEVGDVLWYVAILCDVLGVSLENIMARNIAKLHKRYPAKFTSEAANNRDLAAERAALEGK